MPINQRIFLVGCPRSGTTLLQKHLAAHPDIHSFPESHFFTQTPQHFILKTLGLHSRAKKRAYLEFIQAVGLQPQDHPFPWYANIKSLSTSFFIKTLDQLTEQAGKNIWLEKTPGHIFAIPQLMRVAKPVKFIHIVRDGREVAASLREVSTQYPKLWHGPLSPSACVAKWNDALRQTAQWSKHPDHHVVRFEQFIADPQQHLQDICKHLNLDYVDTLLNPDASLAQELVTEQEPWKAKSMSAQIIKQPAPKFTRIFNEHEQAIVNAELLQIDNLLL